MMAMGLLGLIASLGGCQQKAATSVVAKENPPPKPPNCPDLPELANLRLKDGSIADVRIFRDGDETFYIPFSWFEWQAKITPNMTVEVGDGKYEDRSYWDSFRNGHYSSDVHQIECPGVVHSGEFGYTTPFVKIMIYDVANRDTRDIPPNFSADSQIDQVTFYKIRPDRLGHKLKIENGKIDEDIDTYGLSNEAFIKVGKNHLAEYVFHDREFSDFDDPGAGSARVAHQNKIMSSESWRLKRDSVLEFFNWLKTPPNDRDNDRKFKLGAPKP
jgi:hypothetical protein